MTIHRTVRVSETQTRQGECVDKMIRIGAGAAVALAFILAPLLFFGLGSFLNWLLP